MFNYFCYIYNFYYLSQKFLRKLPGGIFGPENEEALFEIINLENIDDKRERIHRFLYIYFRKGYAISYSFISYSLIVLIQFKLMKCVIDSIIKILFS